MHNPHLEHGEQTEPRPSGRGLGERPSLTVGVLSSRSDFSAAQQAPAAAGILREMVTNVHRRQHHVVV